MTHNLNTTIDKIALSEFNTHYAQLGNNEKQWCHDEMINNPTVWLATELKIVQDWSLIAKYELLGNIVISHWFDQVDNFGDLLNPLLFKHYGLTPINATRQSAEVLALGSILEKVPESFSGTIIGSGLMYDQKQYLPNARVLAVRGALTRDRIAADINTPLGDPGLLVPLLFPKRHKKKYTLGIVPHFFDKSDQRLSKIAERHPNEVIIIDVQRKPRKVIREIDQCEFILSSSLHGLITADSLGIPNAWILLSDKVLGKGFKFADYASAFGEKFQPQYLNGTESLTELIKLTTKVQRNITCVQSSLDLIFKNFAKEIIHSKPVTK